MGGASVKSAGVTDEELADLSGTALGRFRKLVESDDSLHPKLKAAILEVLGSQEEKSLLETKALLVDQANAAD